MKNIKVFLLILSFFSCFFAIKVEAEESLSPVYSLWNKKYSYRFFTVSETEKNNFLKDSGKWEDEGISFYAYSSIQNETAPIYKLKNDNYKYYYYTASEAKKDELSKSKGWIYQGIAFYAFDKKQSDSLPIYALKNSETKKYFYTLSPSEKDCMLAEKNWTNEGEIFWITKEKANISKDSSVCRLNYGPEINVGLWSYAKKDLKENSFKIDANKDYVIKDRKGNKIAEISGKKTTRVKYDSDGELVVYKSIDKKKVYKEVIFEAKDGNNLNLIFDVHRPNSDYDEYRGKIKLKYNDSSKEIWVINTLPMEQYTWGMGETTGTGPFEHTKVMTVIFRTYGHWYNKYATKYLKYGFTIRSDSGSQIYRGYEWEEKYTNIKKAAAETKGQIVKYKDEIALTPYSSWNDGKTRSFKERWGSNDYPWCKSVKDPYGKHPSKKTSQLVSEGNHMVGLIANGPLKLAGSKYKKKFDWIIKYYYSKVSLKKMY